MRSLWNIVSFLAIVHLVALLVVAGWMWQTKRLTAERLTELKEMLSTPMAGDGGEDAIEGADIMPAADMRVATSLVLASESRTAHLAAMKRQEDQTRRRLIDERDMLRRQLTAMASEVESQRAKLQSLQARLSGDIQADSVRKADEQFMQTVGQYQQIPPKQAKNMLLELVGTGRMDQAVAYLDAMNPRASAKIIRELKSDSESKVATELLEELRTFGLAPIDTTDGGADMAQDSSDADALASSG